MPAHILFVHVNRLAPRRSPDTIPISAASILAYLNAHGFSGNILGDFADAPLHPRELAGVIRAQRPVVLGFTAYQENMEQIRLWARLAKKVAPEIKVVLGGPQATFMPAEALLQMPEVDFLCRGEGEQVMLGLVKALVQGADPAAVAGVCMCREGETLETGFVSGPKNLDLYPSPYLTGLIDLRHKQRAILLTSRGCAYDCAFCYTPKASRKTVRYFSVERIIEEMQYLKAHGVSAFWFADTNFSVSRKRLVTFLEAVIRDVPDISFWCQTRYDLMDRELLALLKQAGAESVAYGLESANPSVLERINKPIDLDRLSAVIRLTQQVGIRVELFSMFGLPGETFEQALATLSFVQANRVAVEGNSISQQVHLFFGTPMALEPETYGIRLLPRTRPAYMSACRDFETDAMSAEEIRRVSLIWRLNRADFKKDIKQGQNLFRRAAFLTRHHDLLADRAEATCFLAEIYLRLEEYEAAAVQMEALESRFGGDPAVQEFLQGTFICFALSNRRAQAQMRVIFDCQGSVAGRVIAPTCGRFQEAVLGESRLVPGFSEQMVGLAPGDSTRFEVSFPSDYEEKEVAGKTVTFRVHVYAVLEPVAVERYERIAQLGIQNAYPLEDLEELRQHNINLYYMAVNSAVGRGLVPQFPDALMLINLYLKLGFVERAVALVGQFPEDPGLMGRIAHVFFINGRPREALEFLDSAGQFGDREDMLRAQALYDLGRFEEAEALVGALGSARHVPLAQLRVALAERLSLPLETYLERQEALLDARANAML
ncbi:MAG: radical SAM protein [Deltaproteobacteria bacterium]|nr:radical SAM protein [Deltaproteobacteria bacterium]